MPVNIVSSSKPVEPLPPMCSACLFIGDSFGDNSAIMRCMLLPDHIGWHEERYGRPGNMVHVAWEKDQREKRGCCNQWDHEHEDKLCPCEQPDHDAYACPLCSLDTCSHCERPWKAHDIVRVGELPCSLHAPEHDYDTCSICQK